MSAPHLKRLCFCSWETEYHSEFTRCHMYTKKTNFKHATVELSTYLINEINLNDIVNQFNAR